MSRRFARHLLPAMALVAGTTLASACGFEDPKGADAARGALNWVYPESLHVTSAVWRAQLEGIILRDDRPEAAKALLGYRRAAADLAKLRGKLVLTAAADLAKLRGKLVLTKDEVAVPSFSILLIGPMLWTRFAPTQDGLSMVTHVDGPQIPDIVIVTDEPVIAALASGRISPAAARQQGLMRFYGSPEGRSRIAAWLDLLPASMTAMAPPR